MRLNIPALLLAVITSVSFAQTAPSLVWMKDIYHENPRMGNIPFKICLVNGGVVYASNSVVSYGTENGFFVHKYDETGTKLWEYSNLGSRPMIQPALAATCDEQGNTYISMDGNMIRKISSTGDALWTKDASFQYNGSFFPEQPKYLSYRNGKVEGCGYNLVEYDGDGNFSALLREEQRMRDVSYDDSGNTYFIGDSLPIADHERRIVKLDKDHQKVWKVVLAYAASSGIDVDRNGNTFLLTADKTGTELSKYDTEGHLLWKIDLSINAYCPFTSVVAESVYADRGGNVFVAGDVSDSSGLKFTVCKFSPNGNLLWKFDWKETDKEITRIHPTGIINKGKDLYIAGYKRNEEGFYPHGFLMKLNDPDNLYLGIGQPSEPAIWQVYPNPSNDFIILKNSQNSGPDEFVSFELTTTAGVALPTSFNQIDPLTWSINVANLPEGCYFLSAKIGNSIVVKRIVSVK